MVCDGRLHLVWGNQELSRNVHLRQISNVPRNTVEKIKQKIMQSNTNYFSIYPTNNGKDICTDESIMLRFKDNTWSFIVEIPSIHPDLVYTINTYKNKRKNDQTNNLETFLVQINDKQTNMILFEQTISVAIEKKHEDAKIVFSEANIDLIPQRLVSSMVKVINNLYSLMGMESV